MPTDLENCMESLICIFHRYAVQDGDMKTLSKKELKKLIEIELPNFNKAQGNTRLAECILKDLDNNKDDKLDFEEFIPLFTGLSLSCEKVYCIQQKKCKKWWPKKIMSVFFIKKNEFCGTTCMRFTSKEYLWTNNLLLHLLLLSFTFGNIIVGTFLFYLTHNTHRLLKDLNISV